MTKCPFCCLLHDFEKSSCHYHDGTGSILIREKGPITDKERLDWLENGASESAALSDFVDERGRVTRATIDKVMKMP